MNVEYNRRIFMRVLWFLYKKSVKSLIIKTFKNNLLKIHMKKNDL